MNVNRIHISDYSDPERPVFQYWETVDASFLVEESGTLRIYITEPDDESV
jgi:hypothetical protein